MAATGKASESDYLPLPVKIDEEGLHKTHIISRPGMGRNSLLEHLVLEDLRRGRGVAVLDPHGDVAHVVFRLTQPGLIRRWRRVRSRLCSLFP
jgi:hypothetical protein